MFARIEVGLRPELSDGEAYEFLRKTQRAFSEAGGSSLADKIRWVRFLEVYWFDLPVSREELTPALTEICWDPVLSWLFTGNLIPSASGKSGSIEDLLQYAPHRPGKFWAIERRLRSGTVDPVARTLLEGFEILLGPRIKHARASSGSMILLEGPELTENLLETIAREVLCNDFHETWTLIPEASLKKNDRFHQERIRNDLLNVLPQGRTLRSEVRPSGDRNGGFASPRLAPFFALNEQLVSSPAAPQHASPAPASFAGSAGRSVSDAQLRRMQKKIAMVETREEKKVRKELGLDSLTDWEWIILEFLGSDFIQNKILKTAINYQTQGPRDGAAAHPAVPQEIASLAGFLDLQIKKSWILPPAEPVYTSGLFGQNFGSCRISPENAVFLLAEAAQGPLCLDPLDAAAQHLLAVSQEMFMTCHGLSPLASTHFLCLPPVLPLLPEASSPPNEFSMAAFEEDAMPVLRQVGSALWIGAVDEGLQKMGHYLGIPVKQSVMRRQENLRSQPAGQEPEGVSSSSRTGMDGAVSPLLFCGSLGMHRLAAKPSPVEGEEHNTARGTSRNEPPRPDHELPRHSAADNLEDGLSELYLLTSEGFYGDGIAKEGSGMLSRESFIEDTRLLESNFNRVDPIMNKKILDCLKAAAQQKVCLSMATLSTGGFLGAIATVMQRAQKGVGLDVSFLEKTPSIETYLHQSEWILELLKPQRAAILCVIPQSRVSSFQALVLQYELHAQAWGQMLQDRLRLEIHYHQKALVSLPMTVLFEMKGSQPEERSKTSRAQASPPQQALTASWLEPAPPVADLVASHGGEEGGEGASLSLSQLERFAQSAESLLLALLAQPNLASQEDRLCLWDQEIRGESVLGLLQRVNPGTKQSIARANDGSVLKPFADSNLGLVLSCGVHTPSPAAAPASAKPDPYWVSQMAFDEALRNALCVGAAYGAPESVLAVSASFCLPRPVTDPHKMGEWVRACAGLREAALALAVPLLSCRYSIQDHPLQLLIQAVSVMKDVNHAKTSDFKSVGDVLYVVGHYGALSLRGSEFEEGLAAGSPGLTSWPQPDWALAQRLYSWLGGSLGKNDFKMKSVHDLARGGLLVAVTEALMARGLGASLFFPPQADPWVFAFGEGFHTFVVSATKEDGSQLEAEWLEHKIPYYYLGKVVKEDCLQVYYPVKNDPAAEEFLPLLNVNCKKMYLAWRHQEKFDSL